MPEIITLSVGGAGNAIGNCFWRLITYEHALDYCTGDADLNCCYLQRIRMDVYFNQLCDGRYYARDISIDTDPNSCRTVDSALYKSDNMVRGHGSAGNNFACGFLTEGPEIMEKSLEAIRKEAECCTALQGFQILHSIGGGTGSGFTSLLMCTLCDEYSDSLLSNYTILPSPKIADAIVEPYNAILSIPSLTQFSHLTFCLDNDALHDIALKKMRICGDMDHLNHLIALTISGVTAGLRFPGQLNSGLRKIFVNMVPYPKLHYLITSFAPALLCKDRAHMTGSPSELIQAMFSPNNLLCYVDLTNGKILTAAGIIRGRVSTGNVEELFSIVNSKNSNLFVDWIPSNIKLGFCDIPPRGFNASGTLIGNTTAITCVLCRIYTQAETMLRRRAHLHWYLCEGMEEQEFHCAMEVLNSLIQAYEDAAVDC